MHVVIFIFPLSLAYFPEENYVITIKERYSEPLQMKIHSQNE